MQFTVLFIIHHSLSFNLINALHTTGCTSSDGLKVIASKWRPIEIKDDMSCDKLKDINQDILVELSEHGLLHNIGNEFNILTRCWLYPLYPLDLSMKKMVLEKIQSEADKVSEDFLEREYMT